MTDVTICLFAAAGFGKAAQGLAGEPARVADVTGLAAYHPETCLAALLEGLAAARLNPH